MLFLLAGALFAGSCQGKDEPEESLSADPALIEAGSAMESYRISVSSNCSWTVEVEEDPGWLQLDRSSGHDDATVTARVYENKYDSPREAAILFKSAKGKTASVRLVQAGKEGGETAPAEGVFRIGTYNLRMSGLDTEGQYVWDIRKTRLKQSILDCGFDFFGIQEVSSTAQAWLDSELSSKYTFQYFSPYSQGGKGDRAQGIGYRKDAFTLSDWHYFWASDTPETMTANDTGSNGTYKRGGCCCILTHKASGRKFFFMNNHGCLNSEPNKAGAHVYVDMEKKYNPSGLPSFFVGDMNAGESSEQGSVYMTYNSWWKDSYKVIDPSKRSGCVGTFNAYDYPNGKSRIDFVFFRGDNVEAEQYCCDNTLYGGLYASDHFPVYVNFKISQ